MAKSLQERIDALLAQGAMISKKAERSTLRVSGAATLLRGCS
ncbi:MAG TPA: hypothetical protein ACHBZ9_06495 [Arsenophonus nasoniae]